MRAWRLWSEMALAGLTGVSMTMGGCAPGQKDVGQDEPAVAVTEESAVGTDQEIACESETEVSAAESDGAEMETEVEVAVEEAVDPEMETEVEVAVEEAAELEMETEVEVAVEEAAEPEMETEVEVDAEEAAEPEMETEVEVVVEEAAQESIEVGPADSDMTDDTVDEVGDGGEVESIEMIELVPAIPVEPPAITVVKEFMVQGGDIEGSILAEIEAVEELASSAKALAAAAADRVDDVDAAVMSKVLLCRAELDRGQVARIPAVESGTEVLLARGEQGYPVALGARIKETPRWRDNEEPWWSVRPLWASDDQPMLLWDRRGDRQGWTGWLVVLVP